MGSAQDRIENNFPAFIVRVNRSDSKYCKSKSITHWEDWTGIFYRKTLDNVEDHINRCFPVHLNKEIAMAIFIKEEVAAPWKRIKRIR